MKLTALLVTALTPLGIDGGLTSSAHARRFADEAMVAPRGDGTAQSTTATCRTSVLPSVAAALNDPHDDLRKKVEACTRPLMFLSYKWTSAEQAKAYCKSDVCREVVARLRTFPACVWEDIPSDSDSKLLILQRVYQDCA